MSADFYVIAQAIATRFSSTNVTAPSGESNVAQSRADLPDAITDEPTVLVFPPEVDFSYGPSLRKAVATYPVRFYLWKVRDNPRNAALQTNWLTALYAQLDGQVHLGHSSYVDYAVVEGIVPGKLSYGDMEFYGIEFSVVVHISEALSATAGA